MRMTDTDDAERRVAALLQQFDRQRLPTGRHRIGGVASQPVERFAQAHQHSLKTGGGSFQALQQIGQHPGVVIQIAQRHVAGCDMRLRQHAAT